MPIYEFYCRPCHTVYSFFSARIDTEARPDCPRCGEPRLSRKPSSFAVLKRSGESEEGDGHEDDLFAGLDESKLEGAMGKLMGEMEQMGGGMGESEGDEDPVVAAHFMRRFSELTGLQLGDRMEDLVRRMESGEDPDALEAEMEADFGDDTEDGGLEDLFKLRTAIQSRARKPRVDEELHFL